MSELSKRTGDSAWPNRKRAYLVLIAVVLICAWGANGILFLFSALTAFALRDLPVPVRSGVIVASLLLFAAGLARIATNSI